MIRKFLRLAAIIGSLPNTISNGQTADAVPLMADLNFIVSQVNTNAAPLSNTALLNAANSFTAVQSGLAATNAANFPIASQVQNNTFNTLSSILGTNTVNARIATLALGAYASGQVFSFIPSQQNSGAWSVNIDSLGSIAATKYGKPVTASDFVSGAVALLIRGGASYELINPYVVPFARMRKTETTATATLVTLSVGYSTVVSLNVGSVIVGDRILVDYTVNSGVKGVVAGRCAVKVIQSAGTASVATGTSAGNESMFSVAANDTWGFHGFSIFRVTASGTLTLDLQGFSATSDSTGCEGAITATVLNGT